MSYSREQIAEAAERRRQKQTEAQIPRLRHIQAQALVMDKLLTDHDHWNTFLSFLQSVRQDVQASRDSAQGKQNDPTIWDPILLAQIKSNILRADSILETLDFVMSLPKALIEDGEKAKTLVLTFEKNHASTDQPQSQGD